MDLNKLKKNKEFRGTIKFIFKVFFPLWFIYKAWRFIRGKYNQYITGVYLISHPCSGRTWLRTILSKLFSLKFNTPFNLDIFRVSKSHKSIPNIIFSHASARPSNKNLIADLNRFKNKKIILLVRDPRDTLVSYYFEITKRHKLYQELYKGSLSDFIRTAKFGIEKIISFLNLWIKNKDIFPGFLIIRYEDLHKDIYKEVLKLLRFLNLDYIEDSFIKEAIKFADFENMRKMEEKDALDTVLLRPGDKTDKESYKVRKGKVGGYKEYLSAGDIDYLNEQLKKLDPCFGYS